MQQHRSWTRIALPAEQQLRSQLQKRHWLRLHAWLTGALTLAVMAALSAILLYIGVRSMGLRYGLVLAAGYGVYLLLVRLWAEAMLRRSWDVPVDMSTELPRPSGGRPGGPSPVESGQGGSFAGGGASGHWNSGAEPLVGALDGSSAAAELGSAVSASDSAVDLGLSAVDAEGVILLPVLLVFGLLLLAFTGAGSLLWLMFGTELFLAVAVEVAFALLMARTLYVMEREGWLLVALRLSWKPVLGALLLTIALGWACDVLFPQANTLVQALRMLRGH